MSYRSIWKVLDVPSTAGRDDIRRAYARKLKTTNPEDDAEAFKALREAYELAMRHAAEAEWRRVQRQEAAAQADAPVEAETPAAAVEVVRPITPDEIARGRVDPGPEPEASPAEPVEDRPEPQPRVEPEPDPEPEPPTPEPGPELVAGAMDLRERHAQACDALAELVQNPDANPAEARRALAALLTSPTMDSIEVHGRTEYWLASLIHHGGRGTDALVEPAVAYFGWGDQRVGDHNRAGEAVLERRYELDLLKQFSVKGSLHQGAFDALRRKPTGWAWVRNRITTQLADQVHRLLARIRRDHPGLERHLDPEAVAWWERHLTKTRVGPLTLWFSLCGGMVVASYLPMGDTLAPLGAAPAFYLSLLVWPLASLACSAALVGLVLFRLHGFSWPREQWRRRWADRAPAWIRLGWAPVILLLMAVATFAPASTDLTLALGGVGLLVAAWARVTGDFDRRDIGRHTRKIESEADRFWLLLFSPGVHAHWRLRSILSFLPLAVLWATPDGATPLAVWLQVTAAFILAALVFVVGAQSLADAWAGWPARTRLMLLWGLGALTVVAAGLAVAAAYAPSLGPAVVFAISLVVLLHKIPAFHLEGLAFKVRDLIMRYGWMAWALVLPRVLPEPFSDVGNLWVQVWLLTGVAIAVAGMIVQVRGAKPPLSRPAPAR